MLADLLGNDTTLEFRGKTLRVSRMTLERIAEWSSWMEARTLASLLRASRANLEPDTAALDAVGRLAASGAFDFMSSASVSLMNTLDGKVRMLFIRIAPNHPEFTERDAREIVETEYAKVLEAYQRLVERGDGDPNAEAPKSGGQSPGSQSSPGCSPTTTEQASTT